MRYMAAIVAPARCEAGDTLFAEGEAADSLYNITSGTLMVYRLLPDGRRQVTGFLFPGDFVGLGSEALYRYTAEAITPATLCRFRRRELQEALERFPAMEKRLFGMASHELAAAQDQMVLLGRKTAQEKVASFLLMLSQRAERRGQKPNPIAVPMSRAQIGDYLGLTIETVSRVFSKLKSSGVIKPLIGDRVEILDRDRLAAMAVGR
jgi:CRP/FNR family transcriptional regulator